MKKISPKNSVITYSDIDWLTEIGKKISLFESDNNLNETVLDSFQILVSLCSDLSNKLWRPMSILELFFDGKEPNGKEEETNRKRYYLKLEELCNQGFIKIIKPRDVIKIESNFFFEKEVHGRANLYYPSAKGLLACYLMTTLPIVFGEHSGKFNSGGSIGSNLIEIFRLQVYIQELLMDYLDGEVHSKILNSILQESKTIAGNDIERLCRSVSPLLYYLNEHYNFFNLYHTFKGSYGEFEDRYGEGRVTQFVKSQYLFFEKMVSKVGDKKQLDDVHLFIF